ncbi:MULTISPECIES: GNAT family N-acetyltransferase [Mannheimia]|uniref:tRNA(Met) cytidine acetyltransferase TmcA n=1 Tax=Mannheimia pernigra TaxID=111844 RepID=A0ABD7A9W4_9PAST|nr:MULTISPECIES: GNAT family N-acetyltransferase [Mannheimia]QLB42764.1 tRNA(Met) cytidine acetyltransferase [Mannheimia pernigra]QTM01823.1 GNAT family N-acetyltransferase [Mannheimia sp. ZY171111]
MRSLVIITNQNTFSLAKQGYFYISENHTLKAIPFSNAKTILGQEHPFALYNMQAENGINFHLEAFSILAGTIQENGTLFLLCPQWHNLENELDYDALRWNANHAIACPNFYQHFKQLVAKFGFEIKPDLPKLPVTSGQISTKFCNLTEQQQKILQNLPLDNADIHLITAPRGRGKSTLAGKLAETISQENPVVITARSHSALPNFWKQVEGEKVRFFAPDRLIQAVGNGENFAKTWLFIDEAASLPLPMLQQCCEHFDKVVLTTTTQNYEGTGRGFELKLPKMLNKPFKHWTLSEPLRWGENDPLERFITDLLLLSEEKAPLFNKEGQGEIWQKQLSKNIIYSNKHLQEKSSFYHLLASAHYKTTPTDLRRLFDGERQIFLHKTENEKLIGGIWAMLEGGFSDELTQAIWRGERRPQGNLVAQYLCFQGNLPEACKLHSVRISRIAVLPEKQNQGIGKRLISQFILQNIQQKQPLDFISVSFGLTAPLYQFWANCGFELVQITPNKEASSGYRSAMMIYPISEQGKQFSQQATQAFVRDFALQPFFTEICEELQNFEQFQPLVEISLDERDWQNLTAFANGKRALPAVYISLKRLYLSAPQTLNSLAVFNEHQQKYSKVEIEKYREIVKTYLKSVNH